MASRFDFVVFGATGFTGKYVVKEMVEFVKKHSSLTWAVAGRSADRVKEAIKNVADDIPIIVADVNDEDSLNRMAAKGKVILNCCGPYKFLGEAVVKACIANKAHHVDISGEPLYMEKMQLIYNDAAKEAGVYIISGCGFDSIPSECGVLFLQDQFKGVLNSVEAYLEMGFDESVPREDSVFLHFTTFESAVHGVSSASEVSNLRKELFPKRLPPLKPELNARGILFKSELLKKWCLPCSTSDRAVVMRSQRFISEYENKRPVQIYYYVAFKQLLHCLMAILGGLMLGALGNFSFGRKILLRFPEIFTFGVISHAGPSEKAAEGSTFAITLIGEGWRESAAEPFDKYTTPPDSQMTVRVSGNNPGYRTTAAALITTAFTILREADKMPDNGGVLPPGAAFAKTSLVNASKDFLKIDILEEARTKMPSWNSLIGSLFQNMISGGIY